jgi:hypothetical protein
VNPFSDAMFPDRIVCVRKAGTVNSRGDVQPTDGPPGPETPAYVELATTQAVRSEGHQVPEGAQVYAVFTRSDPGLRVDDTIVWGALTLSVLARPSYQGGGVVWRTWCLDID